MTTPLTGAIERALNNSLQDSDIETDSIHDYNHRTIGETVSKVITLTANGGSESLDCFTVTGCVEILKLYGQITTADTLTNLTGAYFNMWDGTLATAITKNDGVLSGMAIGTTFLKNAAASVTMGIADNATGAIVEPASDKKAFAPFAAIKKTGATTTIRFTYTTTDAPIAATMTIYCEYREIGSGSSLVAV